uniref:Uncharacterized protein n=1 Tax=Tanacetum cinerariifolium TaxID=118510 RepID=A0A699KBY6_TANCI|nr:hypothetical protein [Tanacetum cinerariifolium]
MELKKILIEKMENNKSIHRSDEQRNLYKALVDVYECDKIILDTYGDTVTLKRRHHDANKDEKPSAGSDRGESAPAEEPMQTTQDLEEPSHQEFEIGVADDQPVAEASQHPECSTDLQSTWSLLEMSTQIIESSLSPNFRLLNGTTTSTWIRSLCVEMMTSYTSSKKATSRGFAFKTLKICYCFWVKESVESYKKKLNITKPGTYHSDLKRKEAYTAYSNPKGFIYQNKDKQNRLMRIDELHKFSDGTLNVQTALDDRLKGIRMKYLPQAIWRRSDKERAATMI